MIRVNPELEALLLAETTQYAQVRALGAALTATRRVKARQNPDPSVSQESVWATGTLFRDAALTGDFTYAGAEIIGYGVTSGLTTSLATDLDIGKSVLRIEGGGHWVEGTIGLEGSGADFTLPVNPTATNSIAISGALRLFADQSLPDGTPDVAPPSVTVSTSSTSPTVAGPLTVLADAADDVGVTRVEFYRNSVMVLNKTGTPWTYVDNLTYADNGSVEYYAKAFDAAGNITTSTAVTISVSITPPAETGEPTPVGSELTTITLQSTDAGTQTNVPVTFGQVFMLGALPVANAAVELRAPDNSILPCQLDVKASHPDGSVRHAIISALVPSMAASSSTVYSILRKAAPLTGTAPVPANFAGLNAVALLTDTDTLLAGSQAGVAYTADAAARLAAGTYETWLSGPIVSEWIVRVPFVTAGGAEHPDLHARFSIRAYAGQSKAKIDYIIENSWAKPKSGTVPSGQSPWENVSISPRIYAYSLKAGTTVVDTRSKAGYIRTKFTHTTQGVYDAVLTGVPNDATVYNAVITVDGVAKPISMTGSAIQNYGQLRAAFNAQLGASATCANDEGMLGFRFISATTGAASTINITDYGTLFPILKTPVPYRPIRGDEFIHYPGTRWKKTFWWGAAPAVHVAHNKAYLIATKAIPNYAPSLTGSTSTIASRLSEMLANEDIGQNGITKAFMGDPGYAPGIGLLPEWTAMYMVNQGKDAKYAMLKQADLQGSWPTHTRDYNTDRPINFEQWPYATYSPNAGDSRNPATGLNEKLPTYVIPSQIPANKHQPDVAHHPDFAFVPYMVTGDHCYMEGLLFTNRFIALDANAHDTYRGGRKCLWFPNQVRAQAWAMRSAVHALYLTPDSHPLRSDISYSVAQNVLWYDTNYTAPAGPKHNIFGHLDALAYTVDGQAGTGGAPWMEDFVTAACGRAVELGLSEFLPFLNYKSKQIKGRLTSGADFCWQSGAAYTLRYKATSASPMYTSWSEVYMGSFPTSITSATCGSPEMATALSAYTGRTVQQNAMTGYNDLISGFPANMQPAVAYCATFNAPSGDDAWLVFDARMQKPDYNLGPQFGIEPRN